MRNKKDLLEYNAEGYYDPMIKTGAKIKHIRQYRKLTMKALGELMGFDEKSAAVRIAQWEQGTRNPGSESIAQLSQALNISPDRLLHKSENPVSGLIEHVIWSELSSKYSPDLDFARLAAFIESGASIIKRVSAYVMFFSSFIHLL